MLCMPLTKPLQDLHRLRWLRTLGVVRIEIDSANNSIRIDNKSSWNRQLPLRVAVKGVQIDAERPINFFQVVRESMLQPQLIRI